MNEVKIYLNKIIAILDKQNNEEQISYVRMAYSISVNDKELAFNLGLWKKWVVENDFTLWNFIYRDMDCLSEYFRNKEVENYFNLKKQLKPDLNSHPIFILIFGLLIAFLGITKEKYGNNTPTISVRTFQPTMTSGTLVIIYGVIIIIVSIVRFKHDKRKKIFYNRFLNNSKN